MSNRKTVKPAKTRRAKTQMRDFSQTAEKTSGAKPLKSNPSSKH